MRKKGVLTPVDIEKRIAKIDKGINKLSFLEKYGLFMAKCQVIEWYLKKILQDEKHYSFERLEKMTLGSTILHLRKSGLRTDYVLKLEALLVYRNNFAHDFLYDFLLIKHLTNGKVFYKTYTTLENAMHLASLCLVLHDFFKDHDFWIRSKSIRFSIEIYGTPNENFNRITNPKFIKKYNKLIKKIEIKKSTKRVEIGNKFVFIDFENESQLFIVSRLVQNKIFELKSIPENYTVRWVLTDKSKGRTKIEYFENTKRGNLKNPLHPNHFIDALYS